MTKKLFLYGMSLVMALSVIAFALPQTVSAQAGEGLLTNLQGAGGGLTNTLPGAGQTGTPGDIAPIIGRVINFFLGFLGIVALILIIYGGFLWMTARGDTEQVKKSRDLLIQAVIGLIIILSAYALAGFVISRISSTVAG